MNIKYFFFHKIPLIFFQIFIFVLLTSPSKLFSQSSDSLLIIEHRKKASVYFNNEDYKNAIDELRIVLEKKIVFYGENHLEVARTYYNIGSAYNNLELYEDAKENFKTALTLRIKLSDKTNETLSKNIINNYKYLGEAFKETGDYDQALFLYNSCLEKINKEHKEYPGILKYKAQALRHKKGEHLNDAIEIYLDAINIFRKKNNKYQLAKTLNDLGNAYNEKGDFHQALLAYKESFSILQKINNYDITFNNIIKTSSNLGAAYTKIGNYIQAEKTLNQSLKIASEIYEGIPLIANYAQPYSLLGELYLEQNKYRESLSQYDLAINNIILNFEEIKKTLDTPIDSITFIGLKHEAINLLFSRAECLEKLDKKEEALNNYYFIDQIILSLRKDIETESSNLIWATETRYIYASAAKLAVGMGKKEKAFDFIEKSKSVLLFENLLRAKADRISNLPDSTKMQLNLIKKEINLLKENLVYSILENKDSLSSELRDDLFLKNRDLENFEQKINRDYPIIKNFDLNTNHFSLQYFQNYLKNNQSIAIDFFGSIDELMALVIQENNVTTYTFPKDSLLKKDILKWIQLISNPNHTTSSFKESNALSFSIYNQLIAPLQIPNQKKLLIIPDGILQSIPFEALITKENSTDYLLYHNPIHYAYSASVQMQLNGINSYANQKALIITPQNFEDLPSLQSLESEKIKDLLGAKLLEKEYANAADFIKIAADYQLLHLSTHAAFSQDEYTQPWIAFHDRKLKLSELYTMNLNAQLVTLSACETAKGEVVAGEGVMSLARGFSFAGVPQVITSLWEVNENSTAKIMEAFYTHIEAGKIPSDALHLAKLDYLDTHSLSDANPYYWAAFTALGHDSYNSKKGTNIWFWVVVGMIGLLSMFMFSGKKGR